MKTIIKELKILKVKKRKNSIYGNPKYYLITADKDGNLIDGVTATNAAVGYEISWTWEGETKILEYHQTKSGNIIFDRTRTKI